MTSASVRHDREQRRYEWVVDGDVLAFADYRVDDGAIVMHHTYTEPQHRGEGLAARVVAAALDDVRARGLHVVPQCSFVAEFVATHPEYRDLVARP